MKNSQDSVSTTPSLPTATTSKLISISIKTHHDLYERNTASSDRHRLQTLLRFHWVGELSIGLGNGVSLNEASDSLTKKLNIIEGVVALHLLV